jgi:signal transduction histidine kinase
MRESLRLRLVLWYGLVLTLVVCLYGGAVVYQSWRSAISAVDGELQAYGREVAKALQPVGNGRFDLELPSEAASYFFQREGGRPYYVIWSPRGELIDQSDPDLQVGRPGNTVPGRREVSLQTAEGATVLVGRDISDVRSEQWRLFLSVVATGLVTLAVAVFGGWFVAGRALAPIKRITQAARAMSAGDLGARIPVERTESELEQVASTLNDAFDRLRLAVEQERRFTADASHELRTPISVMRAEAEWALSRDRSVQQYKDALIVCRRATLRMQDTVERLLALVRGEAASRFDPAPVAMRSLIDDAVTWLAPVAQERGVRVSVAAAPFTVMGDAEQLREALNNVFANAIL